MIRVQFGERGVCRGRHRDAGFLQDQIEVQPSPPGVVRCVALGIVVQLPLRPRLRARQLRGVDEDALPGQCGADARPVWKDQYAARIEEDCLKHVTDRRMSPWGLTESGSGIRDPNRIPDPGPGPYGLESR